VAKDFCGIGSFVGHLSTHTNTQMSVYLPTDHSANHPQGEGFNTYYTYPILNMNRYRYHTMKIKKFGSGKKYTLLRSLFDRLHLEKDTC